MVKPIWVQFDIGFAISAAGTAVSDLLSAHLDDLQQSSRTVVAIKGSLDVTASSTSATPDTFKAIYGLTVGSDNLVAVDFPDLSVAGLINPGWMWRQSVAGVSTGDGTNRIQTFNRQYDIDVKSKRSLAGVGGQTLWLVARTVSAVDAGSAFFNGQILLASKG